MKLAPTNISSSNEVKPAPNFKTIETNGINLRVAIEGEGPVVLMV